MVPAPTNLHTEICGGKYVKVFTNLLVMKPDLATLILPLPYLFCYKHKWD